MRSRLLAPFTSVAVAVSLIAASATLLIPPAAAAVTTVSSVDFEDGSLGAWTQSGGGAGTLSVVDVEGGKALEVTDRNGDYVGIQSPTGLFEAGTTYLDMAMTLSGELEAKLHVIIYIDWKVRDDPEEVGCSLEESPQAIQPMTYR